MSGGAAVRPARRVLVVDDDELVAAVWVQALADEGYEVRLQDSALGVARLLRGWRPDVVLLDLGLPFRSGAALLADLKRDPATAAIPVVVLSASPELLPPEHRGLAAAVLAKPFELERVLDALAAAWASPERQRGADAAPKASAGTARANPPGCPAGIH